LDRAALESIQVGDVAGIDPEHLVKAVQQRDGVSHQPRSQDRPHRLVLRPVPSLGADRDTSGNIEHRDDLHGGSYSFH